MALTDTSQRALNSSRFRAFFPIRCAFPGANPAHTHADGTLVGGTRVAQLVPVGGRDLEDIMFDLITGKVQHVPSTPAIPILISSSVQGTAFAVVVLASLLVATRELPRVPDIMAFAAELPAVIPPPPPPPAAPPPSQPRAATPAAVPVSALAAPIEAPARIEPEPAAAAFATEEGVPGGVEGGVPSGVIGGLAATVEGLGVPPPPPVSHQPVRIGGQIQAPALVHRVEPVYPLLAQMSKIDGVVILEAIVGEDGHVRSVKVLRGHPILGKAATDAVTQWQYESLRLDGTPAAFELTVILQFHFDDKPKRRL